MVPSEGASDAVECPLGPSCPFKHEQRTAGQKLVAEGEQASAISFIRTGTALMLAADESGQELLCSARGPGDILGLELLTRPTTIAQQIALTDLELCVMPRSAIEDEMKRNTALGRALLKKSVQQWLASLEERKQMGASAPVRVARFLRQLHGFGPSPSSRLPPNMVLARLLGMRPETLSRALQRLRLMGALAPGRKIRVQDTAALDRGCQEDQDTRAAD